MINERTCCLLASVLAVVLLGRVAADDDLRERIDDENGVRTDVWVYNDIGKAIEKAKKENKPIFVTFRCVPCHACAAFDADVANGNDRVRQLAKERFVSVRQVEMKGVDLSLFQFDHDLNWAAVFINADGVVYARYGTQSAEGPDAYNSIDGLLNTMNRVLDLHKNYPKNIVELRGKRAKQKPFKTVLEMPGLQNPQKFSQQTTRKNCVHCHNIHDAENMYAQKTKTFTHDLLWRYPLPDQVGLKIDRERGTRVHSVGKGSASAKAGLKPGAEIVRMNGQRITSIADMQWVLHHLPNDNTKLVVETNDDERHTLSLAKGWKKYDISWRGSMWSVSPRLRVWTPVLEASRRKQLGIPDDQSPLLVKWINRGAAGGRAAFESGLRQGDVIIEFEGKPIRLTPQQFNLQIKLKYKVGDELPVTVLRGGKQRDIKIRLVE